jgi:pimeloyl-ACP methyl ester carboxylesterase
LQFWHHRADRALVADVVGQGPPVVLLHGQPGSAADWRAVADDLRRDHRVIVPDRLGYARTGGRAGGFAANANAVAKLVVALGADRALVAGHSWAGGVAMEMALDFPARVAGLVLVSSVAPSGPVARMDRVLARPVVGSALTALTLSAAGRALSWGPSRVLAGRRWQRQHQELAEMATSWRRPSTWDSFALEQRALVRELPLLAPRLAAIAVPTVVLVGSADRVVGLVSGRQLGSLIPGAVLEVVDRGGHLLPQLEPGRVASAIRRLAALTS